MDWAKWFAHTAVAHGAFEGLMAAAWVDFGAFRSWKTWHDAAEYDWSVALFRWAQGAVVGAITATGYAAMFG